MSVTKRPIGGAGNFSIAFVEHEGEHGNYDEIEVRLGITVTTITAFEARCLAGIFRMASSEYERKLKKVMR